MAYDDPVDMDDPEVRRAFALFDEERPPEVSVVSITQPVPLFMPKPGLTGRLLRWAELVARQDPSYRWDCDKHLVVPV